MKIETIIIITLIIMFSYLLILNLIRYNTIIEGNSVTLDSAEIENIYTNKQNLNKILTQQSNMENEIKIIQNELNPIKSSYKTKNKEMTKVTQKASNEMKKQTDIEKK